MLRDRGFSDEIFFAELRFKAATIEMTAGAITLDRARGSRVASVLITIGGVFDGKGIFAVWAGRDRSRQGVCHDHDNNACR
jgi:hypothetical protein